MNRTEKLIATRECSNTERCHTMPHQGSYTVGKHSFDAVLLLYQLMDERPSQNLVEAVLFHDLAERWTGDVPAPVKWAYPKVKEAFESMEEDILKEIGFPMPELTEDEAMWLELVDKLDLLLWCNEEIYGKGNNNVKDCQQALIEWFGGRELPLSVLELVSNYEWKRLSDLPTGERK